MIEDYSYFLGRYTIRMKGVKMRFLKVGVYVLFTSNIKFYERKLYS